jgi:uncharacterized membrane protein YuzA (DUF378 family)
MILATSTIMFVLIGLACIYGLGYYITFREQGEELLVDTV